MSALHNLKKGVADFTDLTGTLAAATIAPNVQVASANGAITIPSGGESLVFITKAGVCALTLGVPTTAQNGVKITVVATTAHAHTVTAATIGFNAGDAGADVGTFGGAIGDGFSVVAYGGEWYVQPGTNLNVTLA